MRAAGRALHDALPQPRPRGPRHDGAVRGRDRWSRPDHDRPRPQRSASGGLVVEAMNSPALLVPARAPTSLTAGLLAVIAALSGLAAGVHLSGAPGPVGEWVGE